MNYDKLLGYFTVNGKLYCEADARQAKAAQVISKEQNYQQLKQSSQQQQQQQQRAQVSAINLLVSW